MLLLRSQETSIGSAVASVINRTSNVLEFDLFGNFLGHFLAPAYVAVAGHQITLKAQALVVDDCWSLR